MVEETATFSRYYWPLNEAEWGVQEAKDERLLTFDILLLLFSAELATERC